jgi:hypothetical protein
VSRRKKNQGENVSHTLIASGAADVVLSSTGRSQVMIVAAIAIGALIVAAYLEKFWQPQKEQIA